jgi:hypothetical protein
MSKQLPPDDTRAAMTASGVPLSHDGARRFDRSDAAARKQPDDA